MNRWWPVGAMFGLIVAATLTPAPPLATPLPMFCLVCGDLGGVDVTLNVLLFLPMGAALAWAGMSWPRAALICTVLSLGVESLQFNVVPGRDASLSDLLTNSFGGLLGASAMGRWRTLVVPTPMVARRLCVGATAVALSALWATAALLRPSTPNMGLWGQWSPQQPQFEPFTGTVLDFHLNGFFIPYNLVPDYEALRQSLLRGPRLGRVEITTGDRTRRLAAIARVGSSVQEIMLFGQRGTDFVFRTRLAVRDWSLRNPSVAIGEAFPVAGARVTLEGGLTESGWTARVRSAGGEALRTVPFSVGLGWSFFLPFDHPLSEQDWWVSALWLAALAAPAAYWGAMVRRPDAGGMAIWSWAWSMGASAVLLMSLASLSRSAGFPPPAVSEWIGAAAGGLLGAWLARYLSRRLMSDGSSSPLTTER